MSVQDYSDDELIKELRNLTHPGNYSFEFIAEALARLLERKEKRIHTDDGGWILKSHTDPFTGITRFWYEKTDDKTSE